MLVGGTEDVEQRVEMVGGRDGQTDVGEVFIVHDIGKPMISDGLFDGGVEIDCPGHTALDVETDPAEVVDDVAAADDQDALVTQGFEGLADGEFGGGVAAWSTLSWRTGM